MARRREVEPREKLLAAEMRGAEFGDERLSKRLPRIVEKLAAAPDRSFPALLDDAELEAAYRFFSNESVSPTAILAPHVAATIARAAEHTTTLVLHDTTTMSFRPEGARVGLGRIRQSGQAFFAHVALAVSGDGSREPLGVLAMSAHVRLGKAKTELHERARWSEQVSKVGALPLDPASTVHVMDREADYFELLAHMVGSSARFVVRGKYDRIVRDRLGLKAHLDDVLERIRATVKREVPLSVRPDGDRSPKQKRSHPNRNARIASLSIGATRVTIPCPDYIKQGKFLAEVQVNVVRVWEPRPPGGEAPVEWVLLTTEPIASKDDLLRIVDWYRARWVIEEYFKALKTGCAFQKRQIETLAGLLNVLAVLAPIAWHLLLLRSESRRKPDASATAVMTPSQLQALGQFSRLALPRHPTVRQALLAVAALGGHQKNNGEPGWQTLARGHEKLLLLAEGWRAARAEM